MDPFLLVKLCDLCRDEQLEQRQNDEEDLQFVSHSSVTMNPQYGHVFTFKSEIQAMHDASKGDAGSFADWKKARLEHMKARDKFGNELHAYLEWAESEREDERARLTQVRREEIKKRLYEEGWTDREITGCSSSEWKDLVEKPELMTDRIWASIHPNLLPLLHESREINERADKEMRRQDRIATLERLRQELRAEIPPLVKVTSNIPTGDNRLSEVVQFAFTASSFSLPRSQYPDISLEVPLPSLDEFLAFPVIKNILDEDLLPADTQERFKAVREEVRLEVIDWINKIEQGLAQLWDAERNEIAGDKCGVDKMPADCQEAPIPSELAATSKGTIGLHNLHPFDGLMPQFHITYLSLDGANTTNLFDLPPSRQLLLRADTLFHHNGGCYAYPEIVSKVGAACVLGAGQGANSEEPNSLRRDAEASLIANRLLSRVRRPNAMSAEMDIISRGVILEGLWKSSIAGWADLLRWYIKEKQERKEKHEHSEVTSAPIVSRDREIAKGPFKAGLRTRARQTWLCFYTFRRGSDCPIKVHLRNVHHIVEPKIGLHFEAPADGLAGSDDLNIAPRSGEEDIRCPDLVLVFVSNRAGSQDGSVCISLFAPALTYAITAPSTRAMTAAKAGGKGSKASAARRLAIACAVEQVLSEIAHVSRFSIALEVDDIQRPWYADVPRTAERTAIHIVGLLQDVFELWRAGAALDGSLPSCSFMQKYGSELDKFLQAEEDKRVAEDYALTCQRQDQIKERIVENGWTDRDMVPSPASYIEWRKLVVQPKLLTDRTWANLYPKLVPLLKANREHREILERQQRLWKRIQKMQTMATSLRDELPPFITVSRLDTPEAPSSEPSTSSIPLVSNLGRRDLTIRFSFPNVPELLSWPMIKDIIEEDTSPEAAEIRLTAIRDDVARAVVEWRNKLEQDLVDIWNTGRIEEGEEAPDAKGKGKFVACTTKPRGGRGDVEESASESKSREIELTLPEFTVTFTKPDGTL
ncbi:hypothetical protein RhiJN_00027 [Ceratobasidium sp. AG-Ba]|nr:hypothetical protein RhiJN_00027 [Ceratobasidium sp. AG-Ba]